MELAALAYGMGRSLRVRFSGCLQRVAGSRWRWLLGPLAPPWRLVLGAMGGIAVAAAVLLHRLRHVLEAVPLGRRAAVGVGASLEMGLVSLDYHGRFSRACRGGSGTSTVAPGRAA